jgi:hypothetical protein
MEDRLKGDEGSTFSQEGFSPRPDSAFSLTTAAKEPETGRSTRRSELSPGREVGENAPVMFRRPSPGFLLGRKVIGWIAMQAPQLPPGIV